jgi:hypothetical protein
VATPSPYEGQPGVALCEPAGFNTRTYRELGEEITTRPAVDRLESLPYMPNDPAQQRTLSSVYRDIPEGPGCRILMNAHTRNARASCGIREELIGGES